jgi:hypothetical protein
MRTESIVMLEECLMYNGCFSWLRHCSLVIHTKLVKVKSDGWHICLQANICSHLLWQKKKKRCTVSCFNRYHWLAH